MKKLHGLLTRINSRNINIY